MFLVHATSAGGKLLELNTELLQVIDKIKKLLAQDGQTLDWGDVLLELYRNRDSGSTHAVVIRKALNELNIDEAAVNKRLRDLEGYLVELQEGLEPMLQKIGTPGELTNAKIGYNAKTNDLEMGQIAFLVRGDTQAEVSIRSYNAIKLPDDWDGALDEGRALQELALRGSIAMNGSGRGAWSAVNLAISASMSTDGRIRLYHEYHADTPRIAALAVSAGNWAPPWDLSALFDQLKPPGTSGFRRVLVNGAGNIQFAGGVGVGYAAGFEQDVSVPDGTVALRAAAKIQGSLDVTFNREGSFRYRIEKDGAENLLVRVETDSDSTRSVALNLDAALQIDGLDVVAERYTKAFFKDPEGLLEKLAQWTRPGDWVVETLAKKDWKHDSVKQIGLLMLGEAEASELSEAATSKLKTLLSRELNQGLPFWSMESETLARMIIERIESRLGIGSEVGKSLKHGLQDLLTDRFEQARDQLENKLQDVIDKATDVGTEILDPLEHVDIEVKEIREQANAKAADLLKPAIEYLKRYEEIRLRLLKALKRTARLKIGMSLSASRTILHENESLLSFRILKEDENSRAVHRAFLLGRLGQAWAEFEAAQKAGSIDHVDGLFSFLAKRERKVGFALHFADFGGIERTRAKAEEVHLQIDPSGNILAATAKLSQEAVSEAFYVKRSVGVVGSYDLVAALHDPTQLLSPLAFNIGYEDKKLRSKELRQFLESLEDDRLGEPLIARGAADAAVKSYKSLIGQHGRGNAQARVDLAIPVRLADLTALVDGSETVSVEAIRHRAIELQLQMLPRATNQYELLQDLAESYKSGVTVEDFVLAMYGKNSDAAARAMDRIAEQIWGTVGNIAVRSSLNRLARQIIQIGQNTKALIEVVEGVRAIAAQQQRLAELPASPLEKDIEPLRKPIDRAIRKINDGLDNWLRVRGVISGVFTEALPEQTIVFLALLADLSTERRHLLPIVTVEDVDNGVVIVT